VAVNNCIGITYSVVRDKQPQFSTSLCPANVKGYRCNYNPPPPTVLLNYVMKFRGNSCVSLFVRLFDVHT
jgi:hypothetical protein